MSEIAVVTSCSAKGWEEYGRRFVETFFEHWPAAVDLHLVSEDDLPEFVQFSSIGTLWKFYAIPAQHAFHLRHCEDPRAHGRAPEQQVKKNKSRDYNFRFDAYRFSKKVFAIGAISQKVSGRLFWVDADIETFAPVPLEMLQRLLPDDAALSCLDRGHYHSECGFVGYNLCHSRCREFVEAFVDLYASDKVFDLAEWHDSWVFDWLRRRMGVPTFAIPHNSRSHPFVNSDLGNWMDHKKGRRKVLGKTPTREVLSSKKRALPYWSGAA